MRVVLQRVERASVEVEGVAVGAVAGGLLIFVGVGREDLAASETLPPGGPGCPGGRGGPSGRSGRDGRNGRDGREGPKDPGARVAALADKIAHLRIFPDTSGRSNLSLLDTGGAALVISQFTLYADTRRGRRPSFTNAADPGPAEALVTEFRLALERLGVSTAAGTFGAHMTVSLVNDGPYTIVLDTEE